MTPWRKTDKERHGVGRCGHWVCAAEEGSWLEGHMQVDATGPAAWVRAGRSMLTYGLGHSASLCCSRWVEGENEGRESVSLPSASPKCLLTHP